MFAAQTTLPARLDPLAVLPIFLKLGGRRAVLAGRGAPLAWKAELIAAAGAEVCVFATEADAELRDSVSQSGGRIKLFERDWSDGDFEGAALAILEPDEDEDAIRRFTHAARRAGALVNVIDLPASCEFQFGTIVNRSPLVIGISTDGAAPILGQALRRQIEAMLPRRIGEWASTAKSYRQRLLGRLPSKDDRRRFWEAFVDRCLGTDGTQGCDAGLLDRLADDVQAGSGEGAVEIAIVGAGPGDPELITLKGMRALQSAELILYEDGVAASVLELARREAQRLAFSDPASVPALIGEFPHPPARIAVLVRDAQSPDLRSGIAALEHAGHRVSIVPGVGGA